MTLDDFMDEVNILTDIPVPGDRVSCGLRTDWFKKDRRHAYVSMGMDTKNKGIEGICEVEVFVCLACGKDKR